MIQELEHEDNPDPEVRALMLVIVRTLRYVIRWLERRYQLK